MQSLLFFDLCGKVVCLLACLTIVLSRSTEFSCAGIGCKEAITPEQLQAFLTDATVAGEFVDLIGFHELGRTLNDQFGRSQESLAMGISRELLVVCIHYGTTTGVETRVRPVRAALKRPARNASLEDFERLYNQVDDYGWYQKRFRGTSSRGFVHAWD